MSFSNLAKQICQGVSVERGKEDIALGAKADAGTDVHAAVAQLLYHEGTQPTALHREIVRLFKDPDKVRIVSTNFDDHFTASARKLFRKNPPREYYAPALPLGDDFNGIVYLHGSARVDPRAMVLTDENFGEAYITRGWARDFLVPLFSKYTVLFVGYSHQDVTMSYLARGLSRAAVQPRLAMVHASLEPDARNHWRRLKVQLSEYPILPDHPDNDHQPLTDFFTGWTKLVHEPLLKRGSRLAAIARGLPPEKEDVSLYLDYCLRTPRLANDFCAAIRHAAWVRWMHDHGYFEGFFEIPPSAKARPASTVLSRWRFTEVRRKFPALVLEVFQANGQRLKREFSGELALALVRDKGNGADPYFATWVGVLLAHGRNAMSDDLWAYLLDACELPQHLGVALGLFDLITKPQLKLEKGRNFYAGDESEQSKGKPLTVGAHIGFTLTWPSHADHHATEFWNKQFRPNLASVAGPLLPLVVNQLQFAHFLLRGVDRTNERYDRVSWSRRSIAKHPQNDLPIYECYSLLVDIARDIQAYYIANRPLLARAQTEAWWESTVPIVRRLALHARATDGQFTADERIAWVLQHDLIFRHGLKKEVFEILAAGYPDSSEKIRRQLLKRIERGDRKPGSSKLTADTRLYERFNVLVWLSRADPECALVAKELAKIKSQRANFAEREHPDFDSWVGGVRSIDPTAGVNFEKILAESPERYIADLLRAPKESAGHDRYDALSVLKPLFKRNLDWAKRLVEALVNEPAADADIWLGVFRAWGDTIKSDAEWNWALGIVETLRPGAAILEGVVYWISHGITFKQEGIAPATVDRAAALVIGAWPLCSTQSRVTRDIYRDWYTEAINHLGGWFAEFWIAYARILKERAGVSWKGLPGSLKRAMESAITGEKQIHVLARVALTAWTGHHYFLDKKWSTKRLLPLLDWTRDAAIARQSWSVLLHYHHGTSKDLELVLLPFYKQSAERAVELLKGTARNAEEFDRQAVQHLGNNLAGLAMRVIPNPVKSGFFAEFLPLLGEEVRGALAEGMGRYLKDMSSAERKKVWSDWLPGYVDQRILGIPVALSLSETEEFLEWPLYVDDAFEDLVDRVVKLPQKGVSAFGLISEIATNPQCEKSPLHACRLAIAASRSEDYPYLSDELKQLHAKWKTTIGNTAEFKAFEEMLYLRGWKA